MKFQDLSLLIIDEEQSPYYQSKEFGQIVAYYSVNAANCQLSERNGHKFLNIAHMRKVQSAVSALTAISNILI
ncbi:MAG: hypothetical protein J6R11_01955 [Bacteroidaceae bacterium]|nr:hypothetical protein [Bacteroidaceae bacterium]